MRLLPRRRRGNELFRRRIIITTTNGGKVQKLNLKNLVLLLSLWTLFQSKFAKVFLKTLRESRTGRVLKKNSEQWPLD